MVSSYFLMLNICGIWIGICISQFLVLSEHQAQYLSLSLSQNYLLIEGK